MTNDKEIDALAAPAAPGNAAAPAAPVIAAAAVAPVIAAPQAEPVIVAAPGEMGFAVAPGALDAAAIPAEPADAPGAPGVLAAAHPELVAQLMAPLQSGRGKKRAKNPDGACEGGAKRHRGNDGNGGGSSGGAGSSSGGANQVPF